MFPVGECLFVGCLRGGGCGVGGCVVPGFPHMTSLACSVTHFCVLLWLVGCVVGLLFENYIVNASIFIKKQFL